MSMPFSLINEVSKTAIQTSASPGLETIAQSGIGTGSAATPFADLLTSSVSEVDSLERQARAAVEGLITGSGVDVHQAMIATQKADMAFEFALSVRNKAVQAYQQIMQMQF